MSETDASAHNPVISEVAKQPVESAVAVAGHPLHAMSVHFPIAFVIATLGCDVIYWWSADPFWLRAGLWAAGFAFVSGVGAGLVGTAELLLVRGIRMRAASWTHAVAAMMLISIAGTNWGLRLTDEAAVLPQGLMLSVLASIFTGLAGWHGGKLVFDHGIGLIISEKD
ncbi:Putative membrane protein [Hyphomicrobiales bacterium]|nr:Putative membrane protein [Hyphomicrobiales bacterium]CAH1693030.1 putative membrane protein [Hyphomicrobiales bacterium]